MLWNLLLHQTDVIVYILLLIVDGSSLLSWSRVCYQIHSSTDEFTYNTYKQTNPCQQESSTFLDMCSNPQLKSFVSFFTNWPFFKFLLLPLSESRLPAAAHMFPPLLLTIVSFTAFVAADCDKWKQSIQLWQKPRFKIIKKKKKVQVQRAGGCGLQPADTCFSFSPRSLQNHKRLKSSFKVPLAAFGFEEQIGDKQQRNVSVVQRPQQFRM